MNVSDGKCYFVYGLDECVLVTVYTYRIDTLTFEEEKEEEGEEGWAGSWGAKPNKRGVDELCEWMRDTCQRCEWLSVNEYSQMTNVTLAMVWMNVC